MSTSTSLSVRKHILALALVMPLTGSQFLFGMVPFKDQLTSLAQSAVACINSYCATPDLPSDLKDAPASISAMPITPIGAGPFRGVMIIPPPKQ